MMIISNMGVIESTNAFVLLADIGLPIQLPLVIFSY